VPSGSQRSGLKDAAWCSAGRRGSTALESPTHW
jgi:hypothetical protein